MARDHRSNGNQSREGHSAEHRSSSVGDRRTHGARLDRDPGTARSLGSGADVAAQSGYAYDGPERRRDHDHGRGPYESGGYDPYGGRRPRAGSGYGGYGETPGEGGGGFDSGRNYAAEPGWGPGYGERNEQDARFGQAVPHSSRDPARGAAFRRESVGSSPGAHIRDDRQDQDWRESPSRGLRARRGPKGYERSDERLREDICERLMWNDDIDASEVSVDVKSGIVLLEGAVPERKMKHAIEDVVDACLGVKDIENRIRVTYGEHREVHADSTHAGPDARVSVGTPSGSGVSGMSDSDSAAGAATSGKSS